MTKLRENPSNFSELKSFTKPNVNSFVVGEVFWVWTVHSSYDYVVSFVRLQSHLLNWAELLIT